MQPGYARDCALAANGRGSHRGGQIGAKSQAQRYPSDAPLVKRGGRANKPNQVLQYNHLQGLLYLPVPVDVQ